MSYITVFGKGSSRLKLGTAFAEELGLRNGQPLLIHESVAKALEAKAAAADREAEHHPDYGRVCQCEGAAKAYRHAAELVRQAREG